MGALITEQQAILEKFMAVCINVGISPMLALAATRVALRRKYSAPLSLPEKAPAIWRERTGVDIELNPIQFFEKYWQQYLEAGILTQRDLRDLDGSIFGAIKIHCRNRGIDPIEHLPPPARKRKPK